jgi:hypothetical protein
MIDPADWEPLRALADFTDLKPGSAAAIDLGSLITVSVEDAAAVVAELRAAREVVKAANDVYESDDLRGDAEALRVALDAYDRAVGR